MENIWSCRNMQSVNRIILEEDPFNETFSLQEMGQFGVWPARWLKFPDDSSQQEVLYFKLDFNLDADEKIRIHVSGDERYRLFLDGALISQGPSRGDNANWFFKTYDLNLSKGQHVFVAQVWRLGDLAPFAQIKGETGFVLAAEDSFSEILNTGIAPWQVKQAGGYRFRMNDITWGPCFDVIIEGREFDWEGKNGKGTGWHNAIVDDYARSGRDYTMMIPKNQLHPDSLPDMLYNELVAGKVRHVDIPDTVQTWKSRVMGVNNLSDEMLKWQRMITDCRPVTVAANQVVRVIIDLEDYYCAYPVLVTDGGEDAMVRISWAESLFEQSRYDHINNPKSNRNEIEGKFFVCVGDEFYPDGSADREFEPLWWRAGRYIEILVKTSDQPVTIKNFNLRETRYPLEMESQFVCEDERINEIIPLMVRVMQMCSHETIMDCPYYEQLMYAGDTRLELLTMYCMTGDDRLARKAIKMFAAGFDASGFTLSNYPSRRKQIIPTFSIWWIGMVYDYALWRGDSEFVSSFRPHIHCVLDTFLQNIDQKKQLLTATNGWNFVDWVPSWTFGVPPQAMPGQTNSVLNLQLVLGLEYASQIERWVGDEELADYYDSKASKLLDSIIKNFWCKENGLLADDLEKTFFSEHAQILAILSNNISQEFAEVLGASMFGRNDIPKATISFTHYYFEACYKLKNEEAFNERLELWFSLKEQGFKTTFEEPGNSRSDCHAWGAHPIYHFFATILGIRPMDFGFAKCAKHPLGTGLKINAARLLDIECTPELKTAVS